MPKKKEKSTPSGSTGEKGSCCSVVAIVAVDERGQMVLPKEVRERAKIATGDKLAVVSWEKEGEVCCFSLLKTDALSSTIKDLLGPLMKEASDQEK